MLKHEHHMKQAAFQKYILISYLNYSSTQSQALIRIAKLLDLEVETTSYLNILNSHADLIKKSVFKCIAASYHVLNRHILSRLKKASLVLTSLERITLEAITHK